MRDCFHRARAIFFAVAFGLGICGLHSAMAASGDSHWDRQFGLPGTTNRVFAMRFNGNDLYTAGYGLGPGGQVFSNMTVDIFNGTNATNRGPTLVDLSGGSYVLYDFGFLGGDVYVGGAFSKAGGISTPGLAKWNGSDWSSIGFAGVALAMTSDGTNLYVGGVFTNAGGVLNTNIARYDGTNWYSLGGGVGFYSPGLSSYVYTLEWHNGLLYAGGVFTNAGNIAATNIAVWNGSNWSALGAGSANGANGEVMAFAWLGTDMYVGGSFTIAGGLTANGLAKWDGSAWSAVGGTGCKGGVGCIGILGTDIYVGGGFTNVNGVSARALAKWNGASWQTWPTTDGVFQYPLNDTPNRMLVKNGSLYIGGLFNEAGDVIANNIVRYDGTNFFPLGSKPANGFTSPTINVSCIGQANDGIYVGGLLAAAGKTLANRIARWDGTNWYPLGGGTMGGASSANRVLAIAGRGTDAFVGGTFTNVGGINVSNIARWDGANWWNMGLGFDSSVSALATTPGAVYAGGSFTNVFDPPSGFTVNHIAGWDGAHWFSLGTGVNPNGTVNAIATSGNNVYIGGTFTNAGGVAANRIAVWNGSIWASLGTGTANGLSGTVLAIALKNTDVYVGGTFTNAGTSVVRGIAKWDGAAWSGLGAGATGDAAGEVRALAFGADGKLYAAGRFTNMSGLNVANIARWTGSAWEAMGSGLTADSSLIRVTGLAVRGSDVFSIGTFGRAGLCDSSGIARWNDSLNFTPPITMNFSRTSIQPGNLFKSRFNCTDPATYVIEYSDDLQNWNPSLTNTSCQFDFTNTISATTPRRIYRSRSLP